MIAHLGGRHIGCHSRKGASYKFQIRNPKLEQFQITKRHNLYRGRRLSNLAFRSTSPRLTVACDSYLKGTVRPVNIEMPLRVYDGFVNKCDQASREYIILKNALLVRPEKEQDRLAEICCTIEEADKLIVLAAAIHPNAVEYIKRAIVASLSSD